MDVRKQGLVRMLKLGFAGVFAPGAPATPAGTMEAGAEATDLGTWEGVGGTFK